MFLFLHAPVAIALTEKINDPLATFAIGTASHFLTDLIPHGDRQIDEWMQKKPRRARLAIFAILGSVDTVLVCLIVWKLAINAGVHTNVIAAILGSIAPDYLWGLHELTKWRFLDKYRKFHNWFQSFRGRDVPFWLGLAYQVVVTAFLINFINR